MSEASSELSRSWSELPLSALTLTFEKLPLSQRAGMVDCVARVCSSWAQAAAAATRSIVLDSTDRTDTDSLQRWLHSRGASVLEIDVSNSSGVITALPCPKLQDLVLFNSRIDLRPRSQLLRDLCSATALTRLRFRDVTYQGEPDLAALLLALPNLQELRLLDLYSGRFFQVQDSTPQQQQQPHASTSSEVQDIHAPSQQLWSAHGDPQDGYRCFTDSGMEFICKLTKLQGLELSSLQGVTEAGLAGLVKLQDLQSLNLTNIILEISLRDVPTFSQMTHLTKLTLHWVWDCPGPCREFDPSFLAHMPQLEDLAILCCTPAGGAAGAAELLSRLSQLPELRRLDLTYVLGLEQCPPEAFSSLTSSSVLESLTWLPWMLSWRQPAPWQHMFPDTLRLSALTELSLADAMTWEVSDLDQLVSSCSNLQTLSLRCSEGLQLTPLLQLTELTYLWLVGVPEDSTVASLVQLSALQGLQELILMHPCRFTDDALRSLTVLTQLTCLGLSDNDGVCSAAMQQQLRQQFGQRRRDFERHIITNTLLSCCEGCAQATQQHEAAPHAALEQQQQQQEEEEAPAAPPQQQQEAVEAPQQQVVEALQQQQREEEEEEKVEEDSQEQEASPPSLPQQQQQQQEGGRGISTISGTDTAAAGATC